VDFGEFRRHALRLFLVFLALTGLLAIGCVLFWEFGEFQLKVLASSFAICSASICAMGCAAYIDAHGKRGWGTLGIGTAVLAGIAFIYGLWGNVDGDRFWQVALSLLVIAVAIFHALLILLPRLDAGHRWVQKGGVGAIGVLSFMLLTLIWGDVEDDVFFQALVVMSIVVGLITVAIPILMKMRTQSIPSKRTLVLTLVEGDRYRAADGTLYQVAAVSDGV